MKKFTLYILFIILLISIVLATELIPQGDINGKDRIKIYGLTNISASLYCDNNETNKTCATLQELINDSRVDNQLGNCSANQQVFGFTNDGSKVCVADATGAAAIDYTYIQNFSSNNCSSGSFPYMRLQNGTWLCRADLNTGEGNSSSDIIKAVNQSLLYQIKVLWDNLVSIPSYVRDYSSDILNNRTNNCSVSGSCFTTIPYLNYLNLGNITIDGHYKSKSLDCSLSSGVLNSSEISANGNVNLTILGSNVTYQDIDVRVVGSDCSITYCSFLSGTVNSTNNQHSVYYTDSTCVIQSTTADNYYDVLDLSNGGYTELFNVFVSDGEIEVKKGATISSLQAKKTRRKIILFDNLKIRSGLAITTGTFPEIDMSAGEYLYFRTPVDSIAQNTTQDGMHLVGHSDGDWTHINKSGINLTTCDNGSDLVECPGLNKVRQYLFYMTGWGSDTELHQLVPLTTDTTFNNPGECLSADPSYTLPDSEKYVANVLYAYCGYRDATSWTADWIDLRIGAEGIGATPDVSGFLRDDGTTPLTAPWDAGAYTITAGSFNGDWNGSVGYYTISQIDSNFSLYQLKSDMTTNLTAYNNSNNWDGNADIEDDEITEAKIAFSTACSAGNHYYLNGNDLACEADDDTTYTNKSFDVGSLDVASNLNMTEDLNITNIGYIENIQIKTNSTCSQFLHLGVPGIKIGTGC